MNQSDKSRQIRNHCMVVHAYYPIGETRVEREAQALIRNGYQVDVICLKKEGHASEERVDGVSVYRMPVTRHKKSGMLVQLFEYLLFFLLAAYKLLILFTKKRYATIQAHNLPDFLVFAALIPKIFGAKVILDIHDMMPDFFASTINRDMTSLPVRLVILEEQLSCRFANHVICVTENAREALISRGVPEDKISIVMNVADSNLFNRHIAKQNIQNGDGKFQLVYHGSFTKRYGVDLIVQAVNQLKPLIPGIRLRLVGGGELKDSLIGLVVKFGLEKTIKVSERLVNSRDLPAILLECDVGIVPNLDDCFTDGLLPTKMLEYTALGIPVIAAQTSTISTYFDEDMVMYFQPGNVEDLASKILVLYQQPDLRKQLVENSNRFNERYRWESIASDYVRTITRLAGYQE